MKTCCLENLEEDIISKIYRNECDFAEQMPATPEYVKILRQIREQEKELLNVGKFKKYLEFRNTKEAIEAEEQFKLGFKTAIRLIIESYQS